MWLDVAVHGAFGVQGSKAARHLEEHAGDLRGREPPRRCCALADLAEKIAAVAEFKDQRDAAAEPKRFPEVA